MEECGGNKLCRYDEVMMVLWTLQCDERNSSCWDYEKNKRSIIVVLEVLKKQRLSARAPTRQLLRAERRPLAPKLMFPDCP